MSSSNGRAHIQQLIARQGWEREARERRQETVPTPAWPDAPQPAPDVLQPFPQPARTPPPRELPRPTPRRMPSRATKTATRPRGVKARVRPASEARRRRRGRPPKFALLPEDVIRVHVRQLTETVVKVLIGVGLYANHATGKFFATTETMGDELGLDPDSVWHGLQTLVALGLLRDTGTKRGRAVVYEVTWLRAAKGK